MSDTIDRLNDALAPDNAPQQDREGWAIRNQDDAAWASRKAAEARQELAAIDAWEEREMKRVRDAAENERKQPRATSDFFEARLSDYLVQLIRDGRAKKSLSLPGGTLKIRARQPSMEIDDRLAVPWLREHAPDLLKVRESPDRSALRKRLVRDGTRVVLTDTGEVVDWVEMADQPDSATFTPAEDHPPHQDNEVMGEES